MLYLTLNMKVICMKLRKNIFKLLIFIKLNCYVNHVTNNELKSGISEKNSYLAFS